MRNYLWHLLSEDHQNSTDAKMERLNEELLLFYHAHVCATYEGKPFPNLGFHKDTAHYIGEGYLKVQRQKVQSTNS